MFVQSEKFVEAHGGRLGDISVYGQESNPTTRRLAVMNPALRGIEADFGPEHADTFRRDLHPDLRAEYVLANLPFNDSDWFRKDGDVRWQLGVPPKCNANFVLVQHVVHPASFTQLGGDLAIAQRGMLALPVVISCRTHVVRPACLLGGYTFCLTKDADDPFGASTAVLHLRFSGFARKSSQ